MSWSTALGVLCGIATAAVLAPWGSGPSPRRLSEPDVDLRVRRPTSPWRGRRPDALIDDLSTQRYLEALARSIRAGRTLNQALEDVARGPARQPGPRLVHDTLVLAASAGTAPAVTVERAATVAADRVAARQERRAQAAQARLSATVLTWVPVGVGGLAVAADADVRHVVLTTPVGWLCVIGGGGLSALGRWWIRRITEGPVP